MLHVNAYPAVRAAIEEALSRYGEYIVLCPQETRVCDARLPLPLTRRHFWLTFGSDSTVGLENPAHAASDGVCP